MAERELDRLRLRRALYCSATLHISFIILFGSGILETWQRNSPEQIYSVTFEGGYLKGGLSQVPKDDSKLEEAAAPTPPPVEPPQPLKEIPVQPESDLTLKVAAETTPTPRPSPKATPTVKATPKSTPTPQPTKSKATPKPTPKATPKPTPKVDLNKSYQDAMRQYLGESVNAGGRGFGSSGKGGQGMGGGSVRPPEWFLYKDQLESYIKRGWNWHDASAQLKATVSFQIAPDGVLSAVKLSASSGNSLYDESVIRAVMKASPVPPAPARIYKDFSFVELDFKPE